MIKLIQDYKNWKNARVAYRKANRDLIQYANSVAVELDFKQWPDFLDALRKFAASLSPKDKIQPDYAEKYIQAYTEGVKSVRGPACLYRIVYKLPDDNFWLGQYLYKDAEINRCINNRPDGMIYEKLCDGCSHFKELVEYQSLAGRVKSLKEERKDAKQKFFGNFAFWKSNTK